MVLYCVYKLKVESIEPIWMAMGQEEEGMGNFHQKKCGKNRELTYTRLHAKTPY